MDRVTIRDVQAKDLSAIKKMIDKTWEWSDVAESKKALEATMGLYINEVLYESSFGRVALLNR